MQINIVVSMELFFNTDTDLDFSGINSVMISVSRLISAWELRKESFENFRPIATSGSRTLSSSRSTPNYSLRNEFPP